MLKIGIIKEGKKPLDKRVPLSPEQCKFVENKFGIQILVQSSKHRCFSDEEYIKSGLNVVNDISSCDILLGVKEVPIYDLIPNKTYFFFSHTIKEQPYNKKLLQSILKNKIRLIDYETITNESHKRLIGFGRYAGIVGSYNGLLVYGKKYNLYSLKPAYLCDNYDEVKHELLKIKLPPIKIVVTGNGRVATGVKEILNHASIKQVSSNEFLTSKFDEPVYVQLTSLDYNKIKKGFEKGNTSFYTNPEKFDSDFLKYAYEASLFISSHYWNPNAPKLFHLSDLSSPKFNISTIADITCDINGSVPTTIKSSSIRKPVYDVNKQGLEVKPYSFDQLSVMAVDNLPCELPRDASIDFGEELCQHIIPYLLKDDGRINRATISTNQGNLNTPYLYLKNYVS